MHKAGRKTQVGGIGKKPEIYSSHKAGDDAAKIAPDVNKTAQPCGSNTQNPALSGELLEDSLITQAI